MKKLSVIFVTLLAVLTLAACGRNKIKAKIVMDEHVINRESTSFEFTLKDPKKEISRASLEGRLSHKETEINKYTPQKVDGKDDTYKITITNLSINHEYTFKLYAIANRRSVLLFDKTFRTKYEGSSSDNPILISSVEQFKALEDDQNAYYELVEDLDFEGVDYTPLFQQRTFDGTFNGGGFTIKNLKITKRSTYVALFGRNNGTIKNLVLDNINIELLGTSQSSQYISLLTARNRGKLENIEIRNSKISTGFSHSGVVRMGGASAFSESGSSIENVHGTVDFSIKAISRTEFYIGGLAGELNGGKITDSNIKTNMTMDNSTTAYIGGAVGQMQNSSLELSTVNESRAELDLEITTTIERVVSNDKTVAISIGGFVGKTLNSIVNESYGKAKIKYKEAYNIVVSQSDFDKIAIGGFVGSTSNHSEFNNILAELDLDLGELVVVDDETTAIITLSLGHSDDYYAKQEVTFGESLDEPKLPKREGHKFLGWYLNGELYNFDNIVEESFILVAQWEELAQVSLDLGYEGTRLSPIYVEKGTEASQPEDPTREGHTFLGWYLNGEEFDFNTTIDNSISLVAKWDNEEPGNENEITIKFDLGYQNKTLDSKVVTVDGKVSKPATPKREGYIFKDWYLGNEKYDFNTNVEAPFTLVAQWDRLVQVTFDLGYGNQRLDPQLIQPGTQVEEPKAPLRRGYVFKEWFYDGQAYDFDTEIEINISIIAVWEKVNFSSIDIFYIGGVAGESFATKHENNFALNPKIKAYTDYGKYMISPTVGNNSSFGSYSGSNILINGEDYSNKTFAEIDKVLGDSVVLTPGNVDGFFESDYLNDILSNM